ncbi:hypothetical protein VNO78_31268 [Psophocarpus tetragonolobus]|uniref:APO domain-containing protein n=1 Tax=Psophocarpus tetragonolobus TaxID=3891 RepID=A0AAN9X7B3_PSOTE
MTTVTLTDSPLLKLNALYSLNFLRSLSIQDHFDQQSEIAAQSSACACLWRSSLLLALEDVPILTLHLKCCINHYKTYMPHHIPAFICVVVGATRTYIRYNQYLLLLVLPAHGASLVLTILVYRMDDFMCDEIHVGLVGHPFKSCKGTQANIRNGLHRWTNAYVEDILKPIEAFHLFDRLGKRITHEERFSIPRIPAVVELCIQAGVEISSFPNKRRRKPIIRVGRKEFIDADESDLPDIILGAPPLKPLLA